ncbi:hypothetical protein KC345_g11785, partial [Hortaea werneckii]
TGCLLSAVVGAFLAVSGGDVLEAAAEALSFYGVAAEIAAEAAETQGPGSFQIEFLNQLSQELGVYGMSALTAVTAQNTLGVQGVYPLAPEAIAAQLDSVGSDLPPDGVKTGMLFSSEIIRMVAGKVSQYGWQDRLVIDPVMIAKGGSPLLLQEAVQALITGLLPLALVVTPNLPEAEILTGMKINGLADREEAARLLHQMGPQFIVLKGGHDPAGDEVMDLLYDGREFQYMT